MFELDEETEERIDFICQMDLIGRSIADAVEHNIASPMLRRSTLNKEIPVVALRRLLLCPHLRSGNIPALFAELTKEYGPVFEVRLPFAKPMTFISGVQANQWVHRHGRMHLKAGNYFADFEKVYCAWGIAFPGRRRSFPASQGYGTGVFARQAGRSVGRCAWGIAFPGRRRSFPASQGYGTGVFARQAGRSVGPGVPTCP